MVLVVFLNLLLDDTQKSALLVFIDRWVGLKGEDIVVGLLLGVVVELALHLKGVEGSTGVGGFWIVLEF